MATDRIPDRVLPWLADWAVGAPEEAASARPEDTVAATRIGDIAVRFGWLSPAAWDDLRAELGPRAHDTLECARRLVDRHGLAPEQIEFAQALLRPASSEGAAAPTLGRYVLLGEIGAGAMGRVYRAVDPTLRRDVAIKVMGHRRNLPADAEVRFAREAAAVARLNHPNIVGVYEYGEQDGVSYLAMELLTGAGLDAAWAAEPSLARRVQWLEEIARGIGFAHERGVVHRDLKPANVRLGADGIPRVMDFGLALLQGDYTRVTAPGTVMGTPSYMAPEQVEGLEAGPPADVFSLGIMLYETLTGTLPFAADRPLEVLHQILVREPVRPQTIAPEVPADLETVCLKAMEKDPRRRYPTAKEFAEDLRRWRVGESILARPASWTTRARLRVRRNPWAWSGLGLAVACLAITIALGSSWLRREGALRIEGRLREALTEATGAIEAWRMERYLPAHDLTPARRRLARAAEQLEIALGIDPSAAAAWSELGWVRRELGQERAARAALDRACALDPADGTIRFRRGRLLADTVRRNRDRTLDAADTPSASADRLELDRLRREAAADLEAALKSPTWSGQEKWEPDYARAYAAWFAGRTEEADRLCRLTATSHPRGGENGWMLLGLVHDRSAAEAPAFDAAIRHAPSFADAYASAAQARAWSALQLWLKERNPAAVLPALEEAAALADQAVAIDPQAERPRVRRGWIRIVRADIHAERGLGVAEDCRRAIEEDFDAVWEDATDPILVRKLRARARLAWATDRRISNLEAEGHFHSALADLAWAAEHGSDSWSVRILRIRGWVDRLDRLGAAAAAPIDSAHDLERHLSALMTVDPPDPTARMERTRLLVELALAEAHAGRNAQPRLDLARRECDRDLGMATRSARAWTSRAHLNAVEGYLNPDRPEVQRERYEAAIHDLDRALECSPDDLAILATRADRRVHLGINRQKNGRDPASAYRGAEADALTALARDPTCGKAHFALARARSMLAARAPVAEAESILRRSVEVEFPAAFAHGFDGADGRLFRGIAGIEWGKVRVRLGLDASVPYRAALLEDFPLVESGIRPDLPTLWEAWTNGALGFAFWLRTVGRADESRPHWETAENTATRWIEVHPDNGNARIFRGMARLGMGQGPEAIADFQEAERLDPALATRARFGIGEARKLLPPTPSPK